MIYSIYSTGIVRGLTVFLVFVMVLALTYFTTRFIADFQKKTMINGNIEIVEVRRISNTKTINIVRIGKEYYAIGVGKDEITVIGKLNQEDLNLKTEGQQLTSFKELFNNVVKNKKDNIIKDNENNKE